MARVFITGSAEGLGLLAGKALAEQGHTVTLHARNAKRADDARRALPNCEAVVVGDVSTLATMTTVADQANALGQFDAVIHNVALGPQAAYAKTADGLCALFAVNVVAPYVLSALIARPKRLIYLSSNMHSGGDASLDDPQWEKRRWNGYQAYSDSKLHDLILAKALARNWPEMRINAVDPGWVPTRMGGASAPDDLHEGAATQAWLAVSDDASAHVTGAYFHHQKQGRSNAVADDVGVQNRIIDYLQNLTEISVA